MRRQDAETMKKSSEKSFGHVSSHGRDGRALVESLRLPCRRLAIASGRHNGGGSRRKAQDRHFSTVSSAISKAMKISAKNVQKMV